jgi:uncharacterized protein with HEPN domain
MSQARLNDYLNHIIQASSDACFYIEGFEKEDFFEDKRTQQATIMNLLIIGETATKIMDNFPEFLDKNSHIPWKSMRGMRNRIAHGYFDINLDVVWDTLKNALPDLITKIKPLCLP